MSLLVPSLILLALFFILLPLASICIITGIRFIYRKIRKQETFNTPKFLAVLLTGLVVLAAIPPLPYVVHDMIRGTHLTAQNSVMTYDKNYDTKNSIRYIDYNGRTYQELIPSISDTEYIDVSDNADLKFGEPVANVFDDSQSNIEKYIFNVFRYPANSRFIYKAEISNSDDYISLDQTDFFCDQASLDKRIEYYSDFENWDYYLEDYNTGQICDINLDPKAVDEIRELAYMHYNTDYDVDSIVETIPDIIKFNAPSDYDIIAINGESKDELLLRSFGEVYIHNDKIYQFVDEIYNEDGSTDIFVLPISGETSKTLAKEKKKRVLCNPHVSKFRKFLVFL